MLNEKTLMENLDRDDIPTGIFVVTYQSCDFENDHVSSEVGIYQSHDPFTNEKAVQKINEMINKEFPEQDNLDIKFTGNINVLSNDLEYRNRRDLPESIVAEVSKEDSVLRRYYIISAMKDL